MAGWSAQDTASRAVAEHRAWLAQRDGRTAGERLAGLLGAARAAHFHRSLEQGEPELPLTVGAAARRLGAVGEEGWAHYRAWRLTGVDPGERIADALERVVRGLPAYSR